MEYIYTASLAISASDDKRFTINGLSQGGLNCVGKEVQ